MSTIDNTSSPIAVLSLPRSDKLLLAYAKGIHAALTGNAYFPNPNPTLVVYWNDIDAYDKAETQAGTKAKGAAAQRDAKRKRVIADLVHLKDYVQGVVETQTSPADAVAMITSAGMRVRKVGKHTKPELSARNGSSSGAVVLTARSLGQVTVYYWQYSLDQITWTSVPETMKASLLLTGLTPAMKYFFRFRALTRVGAVDFSQIVSLLVQ